MNTDSKEKFKLTYRFGHRKVCDVSLAILQRALFSTDRSLRDISVIDENPKKKKPSPPRRKESRKEERTQGEEIERIEPSQELAAAHPFPRTLAAMQATLPLFQQNNLSPFSRDPHLSSNHHDEDRKPGDSTDGKENILNKQKEGIEVPIQPGKEMKSGSHAEIKHPFIQKPQNGPVSVQGVSEGKILASNRDAHPQLETRLERESVFTSRPVNDRASSVLNPNREAPIDPKQDAPLKVPENPEAAAPSVKPHNAIHRGSVLEVDRTIAKSPGTSVETPGRPPAVNPLPSVGRAASQPTSLSQPLPQSLPKDLAVKHEPRPQMAKVDAKSGTQNPRSLFSLAPPHSNLTAPSSGQQIAQNQVEDTGQEERLLSEPATPAQTILPMRTSTPGIQSPEVTLPLREKQEQADDRRDREPFFRPPSGGGPAPLEKVRQPIAAAYRPMPQESSSFASLRITGLSIGGGPDLPAAATQPALQIARLPSSRVTGISKTSAASSSPLARALPPLQTIAAPNLNIPAPAVEKSEVEKISEQTEPELSEKPDYIVRIYEKPVIIEDYFGVGRV